MILLLSFVLNYIPVVRFVLLFHVNENEKAKSKCEKRNETIKRHQKTSTRIICIYFAQRFTSLRYFFLIFVVPKKEDEKKNGATQREKRPLQIHKFIILR